MFSQRYCLTLFCLLESEQNVRNIAKHYIQNIQPGDKTKEGYSLELIKNSTSDDKHCKTNSGH